MLVETSSPYTVHIIVWSRGPTVLTSNFQTVHELRSLLPWMGFLDGVYGMLMIPFYQPLVIKGTLILVCVSVNSLVIRGLYILYMGSLEVQRLYFDRLK